MNRDERIQVVENAIDSDVRLLVLTGNVTLNQFNQHLPGVRRALAARAVDALAALDGRSHE